MLRSLFGTNIYRNFTDSLKQQKSELEKSVSELTTRIDQLFQQVISEKGATYEESLIFAKDYLLEEEQALQKSQKELAENRRSKSASAEIPAGAGAL